MSRNSQRELAKRNEAMFDFVVKKPDDEICFALCTLLVPCFTSFSVVLAAHFSPTPKLCLLITLTFSKCDCDAAFAETLSNLFWKQSPILSRIHCRVMFHVLNSKPPPMAFVQPECRKVIGVISKRFLLF
jgi:hypothetical protein